MPWCYARKVRRGCGRVFVSFAVAMCAGCGPEVEELVDCDADGPVALVQIYAPTKSIWRAWGRRDERGWVFAESDEDHGYALPAGGVANARGIAVECGMPPRTFAEGIAPFWRLGERGPWLGQLVQSLGAPLVLFVVDPWGDEAPQQLPGRPIGFVDDGLLVGETSEDGLFLWRVSLAAPFDIEPVAIDLPPHTPRRGRWANASPTFGADDFGEAEALIVELVDDDGPTVIGLDPRSRETLFVETGMYVEDTKMGGRFVVMKAEGTTRPSRALVVDALEPHRRVELPAEWTCCRGSADLVTSGGSGDTHVVSLPSLREVRLEGVWSADFVTDAAWDGRHVLSNDNGVYVLEPDGFVPRLLYEGRGSIRIVGESAWLRTGETFSHELVEIPLDGSGAEVVLEAPVRSAVRLTEDRWALVRDDGDGPWNLRVFDRTTRREEVVAENIDPTLSAWNWRGPGDSRLELLMGLDAPVEDVVFGRREGDQLTLWRLVP
jgi:hypothetical protein